MSLISVNSLTFCYDGSYDNIFENAAFQIDTDWKLGFTGRNGRGKTTLLNLMLGKYEYRGSIVSPVRIDYFPFEVKNPEDITLDALRSACPEVEEWELRRELNLLKVDEGALYRPFATLSHGERTKALLSALFLRKNNFLLIDEPTNHLDMEGRRQVSEYLNAKKGFILVSHDRAFLDGCVDHILSINKADITVTKGNYSQWWENKLKQDAYEQSENQKLLGQITHLTQAARRSAGWADDVEDSKIGGHSADRGAVGAQSARMMKKAKAIENRRERAIEEKSKLLKNIERNENLSIRPLPPPRRRLVEGRELSLSYGQREVLRDFSFEATAGSILALCGKNGCGKSSVLKAVAQAAGCDMHGAASVPMEGILRLPSGLIISYVPQDTSFLAGDPLYFARRMGIDESLFLTILRKMDFPRVQFEKNMEDYSAGQRKKVLLSASLCQRAHLYIWDEPLNYVDILSRMQIEALINQSSPAMLLVEHDRAFLENIGAQCLIMDM